jgi:nucleoside-diphosphate-sugar epimerase
MKKTYVAMNEVFVNNQTKVLVTGASGFVGNRLANELSNRGYEVSRAVRQSNNKAEIEVGDLSANTNWTAALLGVSCVIHTAARVHVMNECVDDPMALFRTVNVIGTVNLAKQAKQAGVKRFIYISSVKVNGELTPAAAAFTELNVANPQDPYGKSKHEAELALKLLAEESDMEVVIIRPPLVYGPGVKANFAALMRAVQRGWPLPLGAVHNQRSFVALDNLVDFIITCITHPNAANQTFFVSDGRDLSTTELIEHMASAAGVPAFLLPVPVWLLQFGANLFGKDDAVQRLCGNLQVDISKAKDLLQWTPPLLVDQALRLVNDNELSGMVNKDI